MVTREPSADEILAWLDDVKDPEVPVISIADLGVLRGVEWRDDGGRRTLHVAITPTYSGCPAMRQIERDVAETLRAHGVAEVAIDVRLAPAWTTDAMTQRGRDNLRAYGIAPPGRRASVAPGTIDLVGMAGAAEGVACPRCGSGDVVELSRFASTACKALYRCNACREPFDHFKSH